jgi:hypothetical protein
VKEIHNQLRISVEEKCGVRTWILISVLDLPDFGLHFVLALDVLGFFLPRDRYHLAEDCLGNAFPGALLLHLAELGGAIENPSVRRPANLLPRGIARATLSRGIGRFVLSRGGAVDHRAMLASWGQVGLEGAHDGRGCRSGRCSGRVFAFEDEHVRARLLSRFGGLCRRHEVQQCGFVWQNNKLSSGRRESKR